MNENEHVDPFRAPGAGEPAGMEPSISDAPVEHADASVPGAPDTVTSAEAPEVAVAALSEAPPSPAAAISESVEAPAAVAPVGRPGRSTARWGIALLVAAAVVAVTSLALILVSAAGSVSRLAGWVPPGSYAYAEARLDPPGDQAQRVEDLLGHFPGFSDRSQLDAKITEALDRALGDASGGKVSYSSMKPWLGDTVAVAGTKVPAAGSQDAPVVMIVATKDAAGARDWLATTVPADGTTTETYGGARVTTGTQDGMAWAYTVLDTVVLAGEKSAVEAAIDTKGSSTFASSEPFKSAAASIEGDGLGFLFLDTKAVLDAALAASPAGSALGQGIADQVPAWMTMSLRARSDALQVDAAVPAVAGVTRPTNATSVLAGRLPADTLIAAEVRDLGTRVKDVLARLKAQPATADAAAQAEQALQAAGGVDALFGWMGDGTVALTYAGGVPSGGLVVATLDAASAQEKVTQLKNLASLAGAAAGVTVRDEPYGEGTITVVDLGDLQTLLDEAGVGTPSVTPSGRLELAFTVQKGLFVVGVGEAFVKAVIDTAPGAALADQPRYKTALDRAGTPNAGQLYVDLTGIVGAAVPHMTPDERATFEREVKPFVDPLGALAASSLSGDPMRVRFVVTVQ